MEMASAEPTSVPFNGKPRVIESILRRRPGWRPQPGPLIASAAVAGDTAQLSGEVLPFADAQIMQELFTAHPAKRVAGPFLPLLAQKTPQHRDALLKIAAAWADLAEQSKKRDGKGKSDGHSGE